MTGAGLWRALTILGRSGPLLLLFIKELVLSGIRVALLVLSPNPSARIRPAIIAYPLTVLSNLEITLLANLITLTPGTLTIDVSDDRKYLYIHAIDVVDKQHLIGNIAVGFETQILRLFR